MGEYNITETASFNITLRDNAKYHCETCLTISLNILIFEIGSFEKYVLPLRTLKVRNPL